MQPYQERVLAEYDELADRWHALHGFLDSVTTETLEKIGMEEYRRLNRQYVIMEQYIEILAERMKAFNQ